ncbi:hypothetical protein [Solibacillus isronensis]|uniref:hypothetical protein n=1 Tax=Solibacillus isronensis TaxID=412383 RepID=UPI0039A13778
MNEGYSDAFFNRMNENMVGGLLTSTVAQILSIDYARMCCEVLPLNDDEATPIDDVPFGFMQNADFLVRFPYKAGDLVFIGFCKDDIDPVFFGDENRDNAADELFQRKDAFVIGGAQKFIDPSTIPSTHDESFLICKKDFSSRIEIDVDGKVIIETDENIEMTTKKDFKVSAQNITLEGATVTANGEDLTTDLV